MNLKEIQGYELGAQDGKIGRCKDFLFDDRNWAIRYIVADTRKWLPGRKVLISPISIGTIDIANKTLNVGRTKEQIENSPPLDSDAPVSRQYETVFNQYYDWGNYWQGGLIWGVHPYPRLLLRNDTIRAKEEPPQVETNLRSVDEVIGYTLETSDGGLGHIEDLLVEEETWVIRYLVIDTSNWLPGSRKVIIVPEWVDNLDWAGSSAVVKLTSDQIKNCPEYDDSTPLSRKYEKVLHDFYGLPYYW